MHNALKVFLMQMHYIINILLINLMHFGY